MISVDVIELQTCFRNCSHVEQKFVVVSFGSHRVVVTGSCHRIILSSNPNPNSQSVSNMSNSSHLIEAQQYLQTSGVSSTLEVCLTAVILNRPDEPREFLKGFLKQIKGLKKDQDAWSLLDDWKAAELQDNYVPPAVSSKAKQMPSQPKPPSNAPQSQNSYRSKKISEKQTPRKGPKSAASSSSERDSGNVAKQQEGQGKQTSKEQEKQAGQKANQGVNGSENSTANQGKDSQEKHGAEKTAGGVEKTGKGQIVENPRLTKGTGSPVPSLDLSRVESYEERLTKDSNQKHSAKSTFSDRSFESPKELDAELLIRYEPRSPRPPAGFKGPVTAQEQALEETLEQELLSGESKLRQELPADPRLVFRRPTKASSPQSRSPRSPLSSYRSQQSDDDAQSTAILEYLEDANNPYFEDLSGELYRTEKLVPVAVPVQDDEVLGELTRHEF
eukprot:TRINITY_DN1595_c0_g1_i2.p1 TRINITY_DN1595_c0_g1~~TRINITY_DN1595_c0_g1_i2.p1  ORF type:complete len:445 (-),score=99.23 TRINITY_DN1595_c0_g1_i2:250-1584(-)